MPIHYIPNDPQTVDFVPLREVSGRKNRPASRAGFDFPRPVKKGRYDPGTDGFLFWQCREAALAAVDCWEELTGKLARWSSDATNPKKLRLTQNAGVQLNAFYDRTGLSFFENTAQGETTYSGASTDVVSHEAGHAFLDTLRPDLWTSHMTETSAFHEAFGDCMAVLTALADRPTREKLLTVSPDLASANFVEAVMEDLGLGVARAFGAQHPAAGPRHCFNDFKWALPTTLPNWGPPEQLISEVHSFGRVFAGCFYDTLRLIFNALPERGEAALWKAATIAGQILVQGTAQAPETPRFFRSVGQGMIKAAEAIEGGAWRMAVRDAFARHGIDLGSSAMTAPRAALAGPGPRLDEGEPAAILSPRTRRDVALRMGAATRGLSTEVVEVGGERMVKVVHQRKVSLDSVARELTGVVAYVPEAVLVGEMGGQAAVRSAMPQSHTTEEEVQAFVTCLMQHGQLDLGPQARTRKSGGRTRAVAGGPGPAFTTHKIELRGRRKVLVRTCFVCGPGAGCSPGHGCQHCG